MLRQALLALSQSPRLKRAAAEWPLARRLAERFVAGPDRASAVRVAQRLNQAGFGVTLNYLGEHTTDERQAQAATNEYCQLMNAMADRRVRGYCSVKPSQLGLKLDRELCRGNVRRLLEVAEQRALFVRLDMEDSSQTDATLDVVRMLRAEGRTNLGVVLQAYLCRTPADAESMIALGVSVRLCKGAYSEPPEIAYPEKRPVDLAYVRLARRLLEAGHDPAFATHDDRIIREIRRSARGRGIGPERYSIEMLLGIRGRLQRRLLSLGERLTIYVPYGTEWYPYLMRRLAERPANLAFVVRGALG